MGDLVLAEEEGKRCYGSSVVSKYLESVVGFLEEFLGSVHFGFRGGC